MLAVKRGRVTKGSVEELAQEFCADCIPEEIGRGSNGTRWSSRCASFREELERFRQGRILLRGANIVCARPSCPTSSTDGEALHLSI